VRREGYEQVEHVGLSGMDRGCDLVAWCNGRRIGFQCKRSRRFGPREAAAAVVKALSPLSHLDEIILIVACPVSAEARDRARLQAGSIPCQIWALSELDERVNRYPDLKAHFFAADTTSLASVSLLERHLEFATLLLLLACGVSLRKKKLSNMQTSLYLVRTEALPINWASACRFIRGSLG
jgi:Restriction endonuclease